MCCIVAIEHQLPSLYKRSVWIGIYRILLQCSVDCDLNGIRRAKRTICLSEVAIHGNRLVAVVDDFATVLLDVCIDDIRIELAVTGLCELSRCQLVGTNFTSVLQKIAIVRIILHHNKVATVLSIRVCIDAALQRDTLASGQSDAVLGLKLFSGILLNGLRGRQDGSSDLDIVLERNVLGIIHGERAAGLYGILDGDILAVALEGYVATSVGSHFAIVEIVAIALDVNVATSNIDGALYGVAFVGKGYFAALGAKRDFGGLGSDLDNTVRTDYPLRRHRKAVDRRDGAVHVDVTDRVDRHVAGLGLDRRGRADVHMAASRHFNVTAGRRDFAVHGNAPRRCRTCGLALQELSRGDRHLLVADDGRRRTLGGKRLEHNVALGLHGTLDRNGALRNNGQVTCMASVAKIDIT